MRPGARSAAFLTMGLSALFLVATAAPVAAERAIQLSGKEASAAKKRKTVTIRICDNFFRPKRRTVRRGTRVKWVWGCGSNRHNVTVRRAPRGTRKFRSKTQTSGKAFSRVLRKKGVYRIVCTIHEELGMKMTLRVK